MSERNNLFEHLLSLMRTIRRYHGRGERMVPPTVHRALKIILENDDISSRELCELLDIRPSSLSELVSRMEKNELVVKTIDENDKRIYRLNVTEKGKDAIVSSRISDTNKLTFEGFSEDELNSFIDMCDRLKNYIESVTPERPQEEHHHCHPGKTGHHHPTEGRFLGPEGHRHHHGFPSDDETKEM